MNEAEGGQGSGTHEAVQKTPTTQSLRKAASPRSQPDLASQGKAERPPKWVLLIDKDWQEGAQIRNSLEASGYEVSTWTGAEDGRECLRKRRYDLVVASTNVGPELDPLIADLRPLRPPPKVILVTDEDEGDAAARCFLPTVVVVNRPFKVVEVADIAEHLVSVRAGP